MGLNRLIIYCRISTNRQHTLVRQEQECRSYAKKHNFIVAKVIQDIGPRWKLPARKLSGYNNALKLSLKLRCPILVSQWDRLGIEDLTDDFLNLVSITGTYHSVMEDTLSSVKQQGFSGMPDIKSNRYYRQIVSKQESVQ